MTIEEQQAERFQTIAQPINHERVGDSKSVAIPKNWQTRKHIEAFETWYRHDRDLNETCEAVGCYDYELRDWIKRFKWVERADRRDAEFAAKLEEAANRKREKALARQEAIGIQMQIRGFEYYQKNTVVRASDAATAIKIGAELERAALGVPDHLVQIASMTDEQIMEEFIAETLRLTATVGPQALEDAESGDDGEGDEL